MLEHKFKRNLNKSENRITHGHIRYFGKLYAIFKERKASSTRSVKDPQGHNFNNENDIFCSDRKTIEIL